MKNDETVGQEPNQRWQRIEDIHVHHVWTDGVKQVRVTPDFYAESGNPISDDGEEMTYLYTEVLIGAATTTEENL